MDLDERLSRISQNRMSRRGFLQAAGLTGAAAALAACTPTGSAATASPAVSAPASAAAASAPASAAATPAPSYVIEKQLNMYNWAEYISPKNIDAFKKKYGVDKFQYDVYDNNDALLAKLQAGASGYDIASPTAEFVPAMVQDGFVQKLDKSRLPNLANIDPKFKGLWWDPNDDYLIPKDFGTTGILYRSKALPSVPKSWKDFYDLVKGPASEKTVMVDSLGDVLVFPLKMLGFSANSVDENELKQAQAILLEVAPHILALDSNNYGQKMAKGEASLALGWTGVLEQQMADVADKGYVVPSEGTIFWLDTWVLLADAPDPNAAYAFLNFIQEPDVQAEESNYNLYGTPNDKAKPLVDPAVLNNPAVFPPEETFKILEGSTDTSSNNQRLDIWEEFKQKIGH
ncbi:MAG: PotD/PotF family extracellular solute-binding protein [Chloroflexota bacterium]